MTKRNAEAVMPKVSTEAFQASFKAMLDAVTSPSMPESVATTINAIYGLEDFQTDLRAVIRAVDIAEAHDVGRADLTHTVRDFLFAAATVDAIMMLYAEDDDFENDVPAQRTVH